MEYVSSACKVTLYGGGLLPLLLGASWRVGRVNGNYHFQQQVWSEAVYFRAEISCYEVSIDFKSTYLKDFAAGARYEVGRNFQIQHVRREWFQCDFYRNKIIGNQFKLGRD